MTTKTITMKTTSQKDHFNDHDQKENEASAVIYTALQKGGSVLIPILSNAVGHI